MVCGVMVSVRPASLQCFLHALMTTSKILLHARCARRRSRARLQWSHYRPSCEQWRAETWRGRLSAANPLRATSKVFITRTSAAAARADLSCAKDLRRAPTPSSANYGSNPLQRGAGVFIGPTVLESEIETQHGVKTLGRTEEIVEEFFAISVERRVTHPCVVAITEAARDRLFVSSGGSVLINSP